MRRGKDYVVQSNNGKAEIQGRIFCFFIYLQCLFINSILKTVTQFFGGFFDVLVRKIQGKNFKEARAWPLRKSKWPLWLRKPSDKEKNKAQKAFGEIRALLGPFFLILL